MVEEMAGSPPQDKGVPTAHGTPDSGAAPSTDSRTDAWQVVRSKRVSRAWDKLVSALDKLLGDMYKTCREDCSVSSAEAVIARLNTFLVDFKLLKVQIQDVWGDPGDLACLEEAAAAATATAASYPALALRRASADTPSAHTAHAAHEEVQDAGDSHSRRQVATTGGAPVSHLHLHSVWHQRSLGGMGQQLTPQPSPAKGPVAATLARSLPGSRLPSKKFGAACEALAAAAAASMPKESSPDRLKGSLSRRTSVEHPKPPSAPAARSLLVHQGQSAPQLRLQHSGSVTPPPLPSTTTPPAAAGVGGGGDSPPFPEPARLVAGVEDGVGGSVVPWKAKVNWTLMFRHKPLSVPSPLKLPLHEKLLSPGRRRSPQETKQASDERHARAGRLREALAEQRQARLDKRKQKEQAAKTMQEERVEQVANRFEEKIARSTELRQQHIAGIVQKAGEEARKVAEVAFINQMQEEDKKLSLLQKLEDGEARRRERLEEVLARHKEAATAAEEVAGRRKEAEDRRREELALKMAAKAQRKQQAQARLEEERRQLAAAREAARERQAQLLGRVAAQQQQEQAALSAQIEERLREAAARRQQRLELIRERAALGAAQRSEALSAGHDGTGGLSSPHHATRGRTPLSVHAAPFVPTNTRTAAGHGEASSGSAAPSCAAAAPHVPMRSFASPVRSSDRSITLACTAQARLKGMRKRASKLAKQMQHASLVSVDASAAKRFLSSGEGMSVVASWSALTSRLQGCRGEALVLPLMAMAEQVNADLADAERRGREWTPCAAAPSGVLAAVADAVATSNWDRRSPALATALRLLLRLLQAPFNCAYLASSGRVPGLVRATMKELDTCNSRPSAAAGAATGVDPATASSLTSVPLLEGGSAKDSGGGAGVSGRETDGAVVVRDAPGGGRQEGSSCGVSDQRGVALSNPTSAPLSHVEEEYEQPLAVMLQVLQVLLDHSQGTEGLLLAAGAPGLEHSDTGDGSNTDADGTGSDTGSCGAGQGGRAAAPAARRSRLGPQDAQQPQATASQQQALGSQPWNKTTAQTDATASPSQASASHISAAPPQPRTRSSQLQAKATTTHKQPDASVSQSQGPAPQQTSATPPQASASQPAAAERSQPCQLHSQLCAYYLACGLVGRCAELVSLMDQPRTSSLTRPIPGHVIQGLCLLQSMTARPPNAALELQADRRWLPAAPNAAAISLAFQETSLAGLPSMLTAILLHAAPSCVPADASPSCLPTNFITAATLVMRVLNNVARLDLSTLQSSLGSSNLGVEFLHLIGFLLIYCTTQWAALKHTVARADSKGPGEAYSAGLTNGAPLGIQGLLNEVLLLVGYFVVLAPCNQAMLTWGRHPSVLHSLCNLPFEYFTTTPLCKVSLATWVCVCFGSANNCQAVSQHLSIAWLLEELDTVERSRQGQVCAEPTSCSTRSKDLHALLDRVDQLLHERSQAVAEQEEDRYAFHQRFPVQLMAEAKQFFQAQLQQ